MKANGKKGDCERGVISTEKDDEGDEKLNREGGPTAGGREGAGFRFY